MMNKFKNKYRGQTFRAQWWDYGWDGAYFITICTKDREHYFGHVANGKMNLNQYGLVTEKIWKEIPDHFPFAKLDEFVIMPNHIHGIVILASSPSPSEMEEVVQEEDVVRLIAPPQILPQNSLPPEGSSEPLECNEPRNLSTKESGGFAGNKNPMLHDNLSRIIRWYKGRCTFEIRRLSGTDKRIDFAWQSLFHDHIIEMNWHTTKSAIISRAIPQTGRSFNYQFYPLARITNIQFRTTK